VVQDNIALEILVLAVKLVNTKTLICIDLLLARAVHQVQFHQVVHQAVVVVKEQNTLEVAVVLVKLVNTRTALLINQLLAKHVIVDGTIHQQVKLLAKHVLQAELAAEAERPVVWHAMLVDINQKHTKQDAMPVQPANTLLQVPPHAHLVHQVNTVLPAMLLDVQCVTEVNTVRVVVQPLANHALQVNTVEQGLQSVRLVQQGSIIQITALTRVTHVVPVRTPQQERLHVLNVLRTTTLPSQEPLHA